MNARTRPEDLSVLAATPITRDHRWIELTSAANQAFKDGAVDQAEVLYRRGLAEAERLFATSEQIEISVPLPAIMNIACHNLAQLAAQQGDEAECRRLLILAFDRLLGAARKPTTPLALRIACIQHLKYTLSELAGHLAKQTSPEPPIGHYIGQLQEIAAAVRHTAAHMERTGDNACCGHCGLAN